MADAYNTAAALADFSPTLVAQDALDEMTDATNNAFLTHSVDLTARVNGATALDIPVFAEVTHATETEGTALEYKQFSSAKVTLTPSTKKAVVIPITDWASAYANQELMSGFGRQAGRNAAQIVDIAIAGVYSEAGTTAQDGGTGGDITEALIIGAKEQLDANNAPMEGRFLILHHQQYNAALSIDRLTRYDATGVAGPANPIKNGALGELHGFQVFLDQNVVGTTDGFRHNVAGVYNGTIEGSSICHGYATFKPLIDTLSAGNAPRLVWTYDPKVGSQVLRSEVGYGYVALRTKWLVDIKTQDS